MQVYHSPNQDEYTGLSHKMRLGDGVWGGVLQWLKADRQFPLYLQCLLQSRDVFTADFHIVQSHLGNEDRRI